MSSQHISKLFIYPIKSCYGIELSTVDVRPEGLDLDRRWVLIDADNKFLTIRQLSKMTLIRPRLSDDEGELIVDIPDEQNILHPVLRVPTRPTRDHLDTNASLQTIKIWQDSPQAWVYSESLTSELSAFLGQTVRLACKAHGASDRQLPGPSSSAVLGRETSVGFADFLPVLVASQKSLDDMNNKLQDAKTVEERSPITIRRYRPNIVIDGDALVPWSEDAWKTISFQTEGGNSLVLDVTEVCLRCLVPNVDPETGVKNKHEPWDTGIQYRRIAAVSKYKPAFGMLAVPRPSSAQAEKNQVICKIKVGDALNMVELAGETHEEQTHAEKTPEASQGFLSSLATRLSTWAS